MDRYMSIVLINMFTKDFSFISTFLIITILITASIIDIKEHRIPDSLVIIGIVMGLGLAVFDPDRGFINSVIGGIAASLLLLLVSHISKGGLGLGDVKLFLCIGLYLGLENTFSAMLIAAVFSGLFSLILIAINRNNSKREIPFAPFILAGVLATIM